MKNAIRRLKERRAQLETKYRELSSQIVQKQQYLKTLISVKTVLMSAISASESSVKAFIEDIVSDSISLVYPKKLKFLIEKVSVSGKPGVQFKLGSDGHFRSLLCYGGGLRNVISTSLRFVIARFLKPDFFFVLDEVGSNLSKEYQAKFGIVLKTFSEKFGHQIILITHQPLIANFANKIIELSLISDKSVVTNEKRV